MSDNLNHIATWAEALIAKFTPQQRRAVLNEVAQTLRRSQAQRIASQKEPDNTPYTPRKERKKVRGKTGRIKKQKAAMFNKIRTAKHLKTQQDAQKVSVGFMGQVARIARTHQEGRRDNVVKGGVVVRYPKRELLGFSAGDVTVVREALLRWVAK